MHFSDLL
jgi:hypothetical protein